MVLHIVHASFMNSGSRQSRDLASIKFVHDSCSRNGSLICSHAAGVSRDGKEDMEVGTLCLVKRLTHGMLRPHHATPPQEKPLQTYFRKPREPGQHNLHDAEQRYSCARSRRCERNLEKPNADPAQWALINPLLSSILFSHPPMMKNSVPASHATRSRSAEGRSPYKPVKTRSNQPAASCPPAPGPSILFHGSDARYGRPAASTSAETDASSVPGSPLASTTMAAVVEGSVPVDRGTFRNKRFVLQEQDRCGAAGRLGVMVGWMLQKVQGKYCSLP